MRHAHQWVLGCACLCLAGGLIACRPFTEGVVVLPTLTLIPATATAVLPTVTVAAIDAASLDALQVGITPSASVVLQPLFPSEAADAVRAAAMMASLATRLDITTDRILWVSMERAADNGRACASVATPPATAKAGIRVQFLVGVTLYTYRAGSEAGADFVACEGAETASDDLLVMIDPVVLELVTLARQSVATRLDLPLMRVLLVSVTSYEWDDTSLGCPLEGQTYAPATLPGYRIVVRAGDTESLFHTDSEQLYACDPANETLPD